jgi:hypothetical protein
VTAAARFLEGDKDWARIREEVRQGPGHVAVAWWGAPGQNRIQTEIMQVEAGAWYTSSHPQETYSAGPFQVLEVSDKTVYAYDPERRVWTAFQRRFDFRLTPVEPPPAGHLHDVVALPARSEHVEHHGASGAVSPAASSSNGRRT